VLKLPDGEVVRERVKAPVSSKSGAKYWGEQREVELLRNGRPRTKMEVPTLEQFVPRFFEGHVQANRQKPSAVNGTKSILRRHLLPMLGKKRLSEINDEDVQRLKGKLRDRSVKTVNNVLTVLSTMLKVAAKWKLTERPNAQIESLKVPPPAFSFYEFDEYERLVDAAERCSPEVLITVLLGGDAGLRMGEMIALEQSDVDLRRRLLNVSRSDWHGHVTSPKGGRSRAVPMTEKLAAALSAHRHLRGPRVLYRASGEPLSQQTLRTWLSTAQKRAGLPVTGALHILRHTFCSHLAMRNAPALAIQELAGHTSLRTTLRYMHLSPAEKDRAIRLLDQGRRAASNFWRHPGDAAVPISKAPLPQGVN
jgi:integrase